VSWNKENKPTVKTTSSIVTWEVWIHQDNDLGFMARKYNKKCNSEDKTLGSVHTYCATVLFFPLVNAVITTVRRARPRPSNIKFDQNQSSGWVMTAYNKNHIRSVYLAKQKLTRSVHQAQNACLYNSGANVFLPINKPRLTPEMDAGPNNLSDCNPKRNVSTCYQNLQT
jgi:hypothetical protein